MIDFDFVSPTKIYFGNNKEELIGQICSQGGYKRIYIVIGQGSVKRNGLLARVTESLDKEGIKMASAEVTMIPQNYVAVTDDDVQKNLDRILDLLDADDDVQDVYTNVEE